MKRHIVINVDENGYLAQESNAIRQECRYVHINLSRLSVNGVQRYLSGSYIEPELVKSINLSGSRLPANSAELKAVLEPTLVLKIYRNLMRLDLSYIHIPDKLLNLLCTYMNPVTGGYNIQYLNVTKCNLGLIGSRRIVESLYANNTLLEILLNGNNCTDTCIPTLAECLTCHKNSIESVGLGENELTTAGVIALGDILAKKTGDYEQHIKHLNLGNNPRIGDRCMESLFVAINKTNTLLSLNLSNCGIKDCEWTRFLPFITSLTTLNLSFNGINDDEFVKFCTALEMCYCLKYLDLSYNKFRGLKCNVVQQALEQNQALYSLSLRGNRCISSVWTSIYRGLLLNSTLVSLDLSECNISYSSAMELCSVFVENQVCGLNLNNNPLPIGMIRNPRDFAEDDNFTLTHSHTIDGPGSLNTFGTHRKNFHNIAGSSDNGSVNSRETLGSISNMSNNYSELANSPLHKYQAQSTSIQKSLSWSKQRRKEVSESLHALSILAEDRNRVALEAAQEAELLRTGTLSVSSLSTSELVPKPKLYSTAVNDPELIAQSEHYVSQDQLHEIIAESDIANRADPFPIHVGYGRATLMIGSIIITCLTTYAEAREQIIPVVAEYVSSIEENEEVHTQLVTNFSLFSPDRSTLSDDDMRIRRLWTDYCTLPDPVILVKPGNWLLL